jgi:phage baseplate assembly protein gpV
MRGGDEPVLAGVYAGVVTQNDDPDGPGARVKVRFPWMPGGDTDQSHWAPVASLMAGQDFGALTLPEVGDTVFVVFLSGDPRAPVVVGGAWSEQDAPPETNEHKSNDARLIKSRSGHRLLFEDSAEVKVALEDRRGGQVAGCGSFAAGGDSPNRLELPAPKGINGQPKQGVALSSEGGTLRLHCPQGKLTIDANHVEITARQTIEMKGRSLEVVGKGPGKVVAAQDVKLQGGRLSAGS